MVHVCTCIHHEVQYAHVRYRYAHVRYMCAHVCIVRYMYASRGTCMMGSVLYYVHLHVSEAGVCLVACHPLSALSVICYTSKELQGMCQ